MTSDRRDHKTTASRVPALLVLGSAFVSQAAIGITIVTFPWLALQRNGSAVDASIVAGAASLPLAVAMILAGTSVDLLGRRRIAVIADALSAAAIVAIPLLVIAFGADVLNIAVLAVLAALGAWFDPAGMTARRVMLPEVADRAGWSLDYLNSIYEAAFNLAYIAGPGIGGLLIATIGGVDTMWVTAAAFGLSFTAMSALRLDGLGPPDRLTRPQRLVAGVLDGLRFVWKHPLLRTLGIVDLAVVGLTLPMKGVLFPKYFAERNQPAQLGWVLMALSVGGLIGALCWTVLSRKASKRATITVSVLVIGVAAIVIAQLPSLPLILGSAFLVGLMNGPIAPIYSSVMLNAAPSELRGRVVGVMAAMAYVAGPLGFVFAGPLVDAFGIHTAFATLAVPVLLIAFACPWLPAIRGLDDAAEPLAKQDHPKRSGGSAE